MLSKGAELVLTNNHVFDMYGIPNLEISKAKNPIPKEENPRDKSIESNRLGKQILQHALQSTLIQPGDE